MRFIDWFFRDRRTGRITVVQRPNLWLWLFAVAWVVETAAGSAGSIGLGARVVMLVSLLVWAADEVLRGANPWRRCLGAAVLAGELIRLAA